jgi:hypothetical protein
MYTKKLSVEELTEHWKAVAAVDEVETMYGVPLPLMPPWADLCSELNWEVYMVDQKYFRAKHHGHSGVYRLVALGPEGDLARPLALNRICGTDLSGTLYIGQAARLNERLNQLQRSMRHHRPERSHNAANMLRSIPLLKALTDKYALALLYTGTRTRAVEMDLISAYMNSFGDTPPLNYST